MSVDFEWIEFHFFLTTIYDPRTIQRFITTRSAMTPQPTHPTTTTITIPDVTFTRTSLASHVKSTENTCAMACDGIVFDTTSGRDFYGPGGPYAALNGRDASRALATMKINVSEEEEARGVEGLSEDEMKTLREWRVKFEGKYPVLGRYERGE